MNGRIAALQMLTTTFMDALTRLAVYCLSAFRNTPGVILGFTLLYCAFLVNAAIRSGHETNSEMDTRYLRKNDEIWASTP